MNHRLSYFALPTSSSLEAIAVGLIIHHGLVDFFLRVYHKRAVLYHFLIKGEAGYKNFEVGSWSVFVGFMIMVGILLTELGIFFCISRHFCRDRVALLLKDYVVILSHSGLVFADTKGCGPGKNISKSVPTLW